MPASINSNGGIDLSRPLTPNQVNSWPKSQGPYTLTGEKMAAATATNDPKAKFLQQALENFEVSKNAFNNIRLEMEEDWRFAAGAQWDQDVINQRRAQGRPCLTINRTDGFLAHAVNNMRQSRPAIKIDPVGDGADEDDAKIRQGLIRHIEVNSRADEAYDTGFESMCRGGLGYIRIVDDWADNESFDKELFIRWAPNPFLIYPDPYCSQPDWSDMRWCFVIEDMTIAEFRNRFGDTKVAASLDTFNSVGSEHTRKWFPGGKIRIAEYFWIEYKDDMIVEFDENPGDVKHWSDVPHKEGYFIKDNDLWENDEESQGGYKHVARIRKTRIPIVHWDLISAVDILEERIWKGKYIPIIPVIGNTTEVEGDKIIVGMVRYAREPQRMFNWMYTSFVEMTSLAPRAPWVMEIDQMPDGLQESWQNSNTNPQILFYKSKMVDGSNQLAPPPERVATEPPIAAFVQGLQMCDQNLKSIFRIYDASLGQRGPQESALAINARKIESDTGIYNWGDNFIRSLRMVGIILNDLLPFYYNTPGKVIQILQDDQSKRQVTINQEFTEQGIVKFFNLAEGRFSVVVSTGPTAQTKRQEAATNMTELVKVYPQLMQVAGDLVIKEMDFVGKDAISARLEQALPPALKPPDPDNPIPPEAQQKIDQATQMINQLVATVHELSDKKDLQLMKEEWETLRAQMTQETQLAAAAMKAKNDQAMFFSEKIFEELNNMRAMFMPIAQHMMAQQLNLNPGGGTGPDGSPQPVTPQVGAPPSSPLSSQAQAIPPTVGG